MEVKNIFMFVIRENLSVFDNDMKLTASLVGGRRLLFKTKKIKDYNGMEKKQDNRFCGTSDIRSRKRGGD